MMRVLGSERRWPGSPAASSRLAIDAACPMQMVLIGFLRYCATIVCTRRSPLEIAQRLLPMAIVLPTAMLCACHCSKCLQFRETWDGRVIACYPLLDAQACEYGRPNATV